MVNVIIAGSAPQACSRAGEALAIFEQIERPCAERVRRQLADWQG